MNRLVKRITVGVLLLGMAISASAQDKIAEICRDYTNERASQIMNAMKTKKPGVTLEGNFRGKSGDKSIAVVHDHMLQTIERVPYLSERELAADGYAYCLQRVK